MNKLSNLSKRLIAAMALGIAIGHADGHRWINICDTDTSEWFIKKLKDHGVSINNKIYGGVLEALKVIDEALKLCEVNGGLLDIYQDIVCGCDDNYTVFNLHDWKSRIDVREKGKGGIY